MNPSPFHDHGLRIKTPRTELPKKCLSDRLMPYMYIVLMILAGIIKFSIRIDIYPEDILLGIGLMLVLYFGHIAYMCYYSSSSQPISGTISV